MKTTAVAVVLICLSLVSIVTSTIYYVSPYGSDRNPGTTASKPFQTLQEAQNSATNGDTIQLLPGVFQGYLNCINWLNINITLQGPATLLCTTTLTISGGGYFHSVDIAYKFPSYESCYSYDTALQVENIFNATFNGGSFYGGLTAENSQVAINNATFGPFSNFDVNEFGSLNLTNCRNGGGSISVYEGGVSIRNSSLPDYFISASYIRYLHISNSQLSGMELDFYDYSVYDIANVCEVNNTHFGCEVQQNKGVYLNSVNCNFTDVIIENCGVIEYPGAGLVLSSSNSSFHNLTVQNNYGDSAVYVGSFSNFTLLSGAIRNNFGNASTNGGGVNVAAHGNSLIVGSVFDNNVAYDGGAIFVASSGKLEVVNSVIQNNSAYYAGAYDCAPNSGAATLTFKNCFFENNVNISGEGDICPTSPPA